MCNIDFKINEQNGTHRQAMRARAERDRQRDISSICDTHRTAGCSILEGCCLSNLWEAITYTALHTDEHTHKHAHTQAHTQAYSNIFAHVHTHAYTHTNFMMCEVK